MNEIEKIKRYIERTKISYPSRYEMSLLEAVVLEGAAAENALDAVYIAYLYGRAKGFRSAKAEGRARA